jgi:hypothetical protein
VLLVPNIIGEAPKVAIPNGIVIPLPTDPINPEPVGKNE